MQNPYGAVPEAIKDVRVSLRDVMTDFLASKKMESDLNIARTKAETETAMVGAQADRARMENEKDLMRMNTQEDQFNQRQELDTRRLSLSEAAQADARRLQDANIRHIDAQTTDLHRKAQADGQIVTAEQYARERGATHLLPIFGIDPKMKMSRKQFDGFGSQIDAMVKSNPMINVILNGKKLQSDLEALSAQYKTPGLPAATKAKIGEEMKTKRDLLENMDYFIMSAKDPDPVKVAAAAQKTWAENPDLATQYKNYDEYHEAFANSMRVTRGHFHDSINQAKFFEATKDISPTYMEDLQKAQTLVAAMPDQAKAKQVSAHGKKLLSSGKYKEAHEYMTKWSQALSAAAEKAPATPAPTQSRTPAAEASPASSSVRRDNVDAIRESVSPAAEKKEIQSLVDYKMRLSGIKKTSPNYEQALKQARDQAEKEIRDRYSGLRKAAETYVAAGYD